MQTQTPTRIRLSSLAKLELRTMGFSLEEGSRLLERAILTAAGKRKQIWEGRGITEAKIQFDGGRCIGCLYQDEPDTTFLVIKVFATRYDD